MENIISQLNKAYSLSIDASKKLAKVIRVDQLEKGSIFIEDGRSNNKEYLLFDGICRSFLYNSKGDDVSLSFFISDIPISPNFLRTKSDKSILNVQAISDVRLASFLTTDLMRLMSENREIELWGNAVVQRELLQKISKEINQISLSAKDRLIDFREQYPMLENLIPHSYISSYLGITNVSLSRIRKDLSS